jgi:NitT/TauT family transport system substrate-binding protein
MRVWRSLLTILAGCALVLDVAGAAAAGPVKIRIGWVVVPANLAPILFEKPGVARHVGKSYTVENFRFSGTPQIITGMASGDLDFGMLSFSAFALAVENAGLDDLRVIADSFQDGVDGYHTNEYMVLKDSPIKTIADLKGMVLGTNQVGSAIDMAIRVMLRKNGLEDRKDVTIIEVPFPNMKPMLVEKKLALISAVVPFAMDPGLRQIARPIFTQKQAIGTSEMILWAARAPFLQKNHVALVDFMEDMPCVLHWYTDPANHEEAVDIVATFTKQPRSYYDSWIFTKLDYFRDPEGRPNLDSLQANIDTQKQLGFLKTGFAVKKYADLSLVAEAAKRLQ